MDTALSLTHMGDRGRDRFPTQSDKQLKQTVYALLSQVSRLSWLLKNSRHRCNFHVTHEY